MPRKKNYCKKRIKTKHGSRKCKHPARIRGRCTIHYMKSKYYKGRDKNIRRHKKRK